MDTQTPLKREVLERRVKEVIRLKARDVVTQFRQYPHVVPSEITLFDAPSSVVMQEFSNCLARELSAYKEYRSLRLVERDYPQGYTIYVREFLKLGEEKEA